MCGRCPLPFIASIVPGCDYKPSMVSFHLPASHFSDDIMLHSVTPNLGSTFTNNTHTSRAHTHTLNHSLSFSKASSEPTPRLEGSTSNIGAVRTLFQSHTMVSIHYDSSPFTSLLRSTQNAPEISPKNKNYFNEVISFSSCFNEIYSLDDGENIVLCMVVQRGAIVLLVRSSLIT